MSGILVSYDGTPNDDDALALGGCSAAGAHRWRWPTCATRASSTLAGRSSPSTTPGGASSSGATWLATPSSHARRHSPLDLGRSRRAGQEQAASLIVFGSDYRTSPGTSRPDQRPAPARGRCRGDRGRSRGIRTGAAWGDHPRRGRRGDPFPRRAEGRELAAALGAAFVGPDPDRRRPDRDRLAGRRAVGRVSLGGAARSAWGRPRSVLFVPRGTARRPEGVIPGPSDGFSHSAGIVYPNVQDAPWCWTGP